MNTDIVLLSVEDIRETEHIVPRRLRALKNFMQGQTHWTVPITVEAGHRVLMDGHHRLNTAKALGLQYIPCVLLCYEKDNVIVESRRAEFVVTPENIIERGISGNLYPAKTTRHIFGTEYRCSIPLSDLKTNTTIAA